MREKEKRNNFANVSTQYSSSNDLENTRERNLVVKFRVKRMYRIKWLYIICNLLHLRDMPWNILNFIPKVG